MFLTRNAININNMRKYYRYSHERSSLLDLLHRQKTIGYFKKTPDIILLDIFKTKTVLNLFGEKKIVDQASLEILTFSEEKNRHVANVVYYPKLLEKLTSKTSINQVVINKCYNMDCNNIKLLNSTIIGSWKPYNLYIAPNCGINNNILNDCQQFDDIYNIRSEPDFKKQQIKQIIA
jgi:hypothetical protein